MRTGATGTSGNTDVTMHQTRLSARPQNLAVTKTRCAMQGPSRPLRIAYSTLFPNGALDRRYVPLDAFVRDSHTPHCPRNKQRTTDHQRTGDDDKPQYQTKHVKDDLEMSFFTAAHEKVEHRISTRCAFHAAGMRIARIAASALGMTCFAKFNR